MGQLVTRFLETMITNIFKRFRLLDLPHNKMVFLVRTDLQMGKGKIASQVAHAAILLYKNSIKDNNPSLATWIKHGQPKIVLKVDQNCENVMHSIYENASRKKLTVCKVYDSGKTQIDSGSLTVVGIGPNKADDIDELTKQFKLL